MSNLMTVVTAMRVLNLETLGEVLHCVMEEVTVKQAYTFMFEM